MGSLQAHSGLSNLSFKTKKAKIHSNLLGLKQVSLSGVTFINGKNANLERVRESQRPIPSLIVKVTESGQNKICLRKSYF